MQLTLPEIRGEDLDGPGEVKVEVKQMAQGAKRKDFRPVMPLSVL
jgi:hypothetical protein